MSPKTGRPPASNPKSKTIQVRMDEDTVTKLDKCAHDLDTTRSEIVRMGIDKVEADLKK